MPAQVAQDLGEVAGVAERGPRLGGVAWRSSMWSRLASARAAQRGFELDADGAPAEQGGLDDGGADAGHDVDDEGAGVGVLGDDAPGELGEHLARMARRSSGR